jgi:hypothetical protein
MKLTQFPAQESATKFIVLDVETMNDTRLYHRYFTRDPRPAPLRWPFRRVVAASVMAITVDNGVWQVDAFQSFAGEDDRFVVNNLFKWLIERPEHRVVTWSGAAEDLPLFKTAAMEYGLILPRQLRHNERDRLGWLHLDLALILKAGSGQFCHQSELAARLGLPSKIAGSAGQVPHLIEAGRIQECAAICEVDVLLTSLLLAGHLVSLGEVRSLHTAQYCTMRFVRNQRPFARYYRELGNYLASSERQMLEEQTRWLEAS